MMSDRLYDILDFLAEKMPYVGTFLVTIGIIWHIPFTEEIGATMEAISILLANLVKKSATEYYKGLEDE